MTGLASCGPQYGETFDEFTVKRGVVARAVELEGTVAYDRSFTARPAFTGRLTGVHVRPGQQVRTGEPLASVDASDARLDLYRKQAAVVRAKRALAKLDPHADSELERLELTIATEEAARAGLALRRAVIRAPFDGIVVQVAAQPGDLMHPTGPPALVLVDPTSAYLDLEGDQFDIGSIQPGSACVAEFEDTVKGSVRHCRIMEGPAGKRSRSGTGAGIILGLRAQFELVDTKLLPGMAARVRIEAARRANVLVVPVSAVVRHLGQDVVIAQERGASRLVTITRGLADQRLVELVEGPQEGTTVLSGSTEGLRALAERMK